MNYKFDWLQNDLLVTFGEVISHEDIASADDALFGDPRFDDMEFVIYDLLPVQDLTITDNNLTLTAAINMSASQWNRKLKMALVATNESVIEAINRFIQLMEKSNWDIRRFQSTEEAFDWATTEE